MEESPESQKLNSFFFLQGVKCLNCKYMVHKRCHRIVKFICGQHVSSSVFLSRLEFRKKQFESCIVLRHNTVPQIKCLKFILTVAIVATGNRGNCNHNVS